jgi:hypothetical protein
VEAVVGEPPGAAGARYQVRDYRIRPGELADFISEWRTGILPLRRRLGFHVVGAWSSSAAERFVWVLRWDGASSFEEADRRYYESPERAAIRPDPARHILQATTWLMRAELEEEA